MEDKYINENSVFTVPESHFKQTNGIIAEVTIAQNDTVRIVKSTGNGRLDAVSNALAKHFNKSCEIMCYEEHALKDGSDSSAIAYVGIEHGAKGSFGIGIDHDIIRASIDALESAMNRSLIEE